MLGIIEIKVSLNSPLQFTRPIRFWKSYRSIYPVRNVEKWPTAEHSPDRNG